MRKFLSLFAAFLFLGVTQMWGENLTKTEGFETKAVSTNYQSTVTVSEAESDCGIGWSIYYGTVSTNDKISGNNSAQMRYYSNKDDRGYVQSTTPVEGLSNVAFKARVSNVSMKLTVSYSADGSAWTALATNIAFEAAGAQGVKTLNYDIPSGGKYIKFEVAEGSTQPSSSNIKLIIDDVVFTYAEQGGDDPQPTTQDLYLKLSSDWAGWPAKYAMYYFNSADNTQNGWSEFMTAVEGEVDMYTGTIPVGYDKVIMVRLNGEATERNWDNKWSQTVNLDVPTNDNNLFTVTSGGTGDQCDGTWSVYGEGGDDPEPVDPTPAEKDSIYFVNVAGWTAPRVHLWGGTAAGTEWPGVEMTKLEEQINNYDVYKYVADKGAYVKCIFSDNGENQTADLDWTSGKYFYNDTWYALNEIPAPLPDAVPLEGNIWKVTVETPLVAGSHYINEALLTMDGVYATNLKTNTRTIAGEEFTHAIQVRTDGYPTAENKAGKEKSGSTSLIITAKEDADVTFYYNRQVVGEGGTDNDNKDLIVFDQADITTKIAGVFTIDQILEGNNYMNVTKKVALKKDHTYTVTASGTTLQLHGIKLEAHFPVMQIAGAWNVQDEAWLLNDMSLAEDKLTATYEVELAKGDYEFKMIKDGAWLTKANSGQAYGLHREWPGVAGVIDNATENLKVTADVAGNYVFTWTFANDSIGIAFPEAPIEPTPNYYIIGAGEAFGEWSFVPVMQDTFKLSNLEAGDYMFRIAFEEGNWENTKGYSDLTEKTEGLSANEDNNILFTLAEAGDVAVVYNDTVFRVIGNFYVAPVVEPAKFYVTGDSALLADAADDATLAWNPSAIKAEADTLVLNLKAEQVYKLKVSLDGTWNEGKVKGFNDLTEKPAGVTMDNDENILFTLAEAGDVAVVYNDTVFRVIGNFYVAPVVEPAKFYVTGDSALLADAADDATLAWNPSAIKAEADTLVLNLKAEQVYKLKVSLDGTWNEGKVKGFNDLTEKPAGVTMDNDENILFTLAEAGDVAVVYNDTVFRVIGNFYVAPVVEPAKFYVTGDSALLADAADDATLAWNPSAIKAEADTLVLNLKAEQVYKLKVTLDGTWNTAKGFNDLTEKPAGVTMDNDENIIFSLAEAGAVQVIYIAGETPIFKLAGNFYVAPAPDPTVSVFGSMTDPAWKVEVPFVLSDDKTYASLTVENIGAGDYDFKFVINGEWRSNGYTYHRGFPGAAGITENNDQNMVFQADVDGEYTITWFLANDSLAITYPELPFTCDWDNIAWLDGSDEQIKVCKESEAVSVINVQKPSWAAEKGIYMTFPSAAWGAISLEEGSYVTEGAGLLVYLSALTQEYNEISIVCQDVEYIINVYNADNMPKPAFYLVGNFNEWTAAEAYKFALNPNNDAEYVLTATLAEKDSLKVIRVMEGEETVWYPADAENYVVDAAHAGEKDIYFRPDYQGGEDWYAQCIYVAENAPQGCDWDHIDFIGSAVPELADQFKLCKEGQYPSVINIQNSFGTEAGIYVTFPSAAFGEISMTEGTYAIQGAGMLLYCSAFTDVETEVSIVCDGNPIIFTVYNAEGSAPVVDPTVSVKGSMNDWAEEIPFVLSDDKTYASLTVENIGADEYEFKFIINGEWRSNGYRFHREFTGAAGITENNEANMVFVADQDGQYTFYWYFANDSAAIVYPEKPEPVLANGYYLVGTMNDWTPATENLFEQNPDNNAEYQLAINLAVGDEIKVVEVENDAIKTWFPAEGDNYLVDGNHAGATTMYFRPDYQGGEDWFAGCIYVVPTSHTDIDNVNAAVEAVKIIRDGQLLIIKGEKTYTIMGQLVK